MKPARRNEYRLVWAAEDPTEHVLVPSETVCPEGRTRRQWPLDRQKEEMEKEKLAVMSDVDTSRASAYRCRGQREHRHTPSRGRLLEGGEDRQLGPPQGPNGLPLAWSGVG